MLPNIGKKLEKNSLKPDIGPLPYYTLIKIHIKFIFKKLTD